MIIYQAGSVSSNSFQTEPTEVGGIFLYKMGNNFLDRNYLYDLNIC